MKTTILLISLVSFSCFGQKNTTVETDSSVIETKFFKDEGYIGEFNRLKTQKKTYYKQFNYKTKKIAEEGIFLNGYNVGLWKYYSKKGKLEKTINYDNGETKYYTANKPKFTDYFEFIKNKADTFLISNFGSKFFSNSIVWNASNSYYYGPSSNGRWFEETEEKPNIFLMRYQIIFDNKKYQTIEFHLDAFGNLTHRFGDNDVKGIRKCSENECEFKINLKQAYEIGKTEGFKLEEKKHFIYLNYDEKNNSYELIVADFDRTEKIDNKSTEYFNAIIINPWTGKIIEKTTMQRQSFRHENFGFTSGLRKTNK